MLVDTSNRESIRRENLTKSAIDLEITPPSSCLVKSEEPYRKAAMAISRASNRLMNSELRAVEIIDLEE